jgi:hypothetical protein
LSAAGEDISFTNLEPQLLEEPLVLSGLVPFLELGSDDETSLLLLHRVLQHLLVQVGLVETDVDGVTGRHQVIVVDDLKIEDAFNRAAHMQENNCLKLPQI